MLWIVSIVASFVSLAGIPVGATAIIGAGESGCGDTKAAAGGVSIAGVLATGLGAGCAGLATVRGAFAVAAGFEPVLAVRFTISTIHAPLFGVMSRSFYTIRGGAQ
ncbi:hypothetical protein ASG20_13025 [Sphingomonas sp. Leaf198]|nr:hypothetical protein ASG20_13025 [Sphingomonas sp. Leaf198]